MKKAYTTIAEVVQQTEDPVARQNNPLYAVCKPLTQVQITSDEIQQLIQHMLSVMHRNGGVGIAANQVAKNWQVFIINLDPSHNERYQFVADALIDKVFINPQITTHSEVLVKFPHGCLSDQGEDSCERMRRGWVATYEWIEYEALDNKGEPISGRLTGAAAIVFQHELLHLRGFTYLDVASSLTRFDQLSDQERQPQFLAEGEQIPLLLRLDDH